MQADLSSLVELVRKDGITDYYGNQWHIHHTIPFLIIATICIFVLQYLLERNTLKRVSFQIFGYIMIVITLTTSTIILTNRSTYYSKMTNPENYIYRLVTSNRY